MENDAAATTLQARTPGIADLALTFARISLLGFGGAMPWAQRALVDRRKWMTIREFADTLALCQFIPGANIINMAVVVGERFRGVPGALAAVAGLVVPPAIIVTVVGILYDLVRSDRLVGGVLAGFAAAAAGLLASAAVRLVIVLVKTRSREPLVIAVVAFALVAVARWSLPLALVVLAPISIALAWRRVSA
jgi:chromate transporter